MPESEVDPSEVDLSEEDLSLVPDQADSALDWTCLAAVDTDPLLSILEVSQESPAAPAPAALTPLEVHRALSMDLPEHLDHTKTSHRLFQKITNV